MQPARKASSHPDCGKIRRSSYWAPWHRSPSYDLRRAPYDHPDFTSNALCGDLLGGSFRNLLMNTPQAPCLRLSYFRQDEV
jgi:hypothetical protein